MTEHSITLDSLLGASSSLVDGSWTWPLHGLRHPAEGTTNGWYVWTGELSQADDFFKPWHVSHLIARCPEVAPYLDAPPGSRFLLAPGYIDTWFDPALLLI